MPSRYLRVLNKVLTILVVCACVVRHGGVNAEVLSFPVYDFWMRLKPDASDAVYREHVNMAIHQIIQSEMRAEAIHVTQSNHWRHLHDSLSQRYFISPNGHIFIMHPGNILSDMYGRTFHWNSEYGWMPLGHFEAPQYVIWSLSPSGWVPVATDPIYMGLPGISISGTIDYHRSDCDPTRSEMPKLSFNDEIASDPCAGQLRRDFGLTMSSGMADIMCAFCQVLKNMKCVWKFCSHPDGVYKIKYQ